MPIGSKIGVLIIWCIVAAGTCICKLINVQRNTANNGKTIFGTPFDFVVMNQKAFQHLFVLTATH